MTGVIVLGGHVQALGILRIYGKAKIPSIIIDSTKVNIARHSKYCKDFFFSENSKILSLLLSDELIKEYKDWIIFPTNDFHVQLLSQNKKELSKHYIISADDWDKIELFYNKIKTYRFVSSLEIPIPETFYPESEKNLTNINPKFPCIIKPAVMHSFYSQVKKKVFVCNDFDELVTNYKKALKLIPAEEIIIQNIIEGPSKNQFSACFLCINGKPNVSLVANRMRQHPIDFGNATTYAETVDIPILREYAEKILSHAKYSGLCEVEFKKDDGDGLYKFLEVNTRTWKWHYISEKSKSPFLMNYYNYLHGNQVEPVFDYKQAAFRHILTDFPTQLKLFMKGFKYAFKNRKPIINAVWSIHDIKPWLFQAIYLPILIWKR
jgi:D-aspartate ligase